jgi:hypothetical protein
MRATKRAIQRQGLGGKASSDINKAMAAVKELQKMSGSLEAVKEVGVALEAVQADLEKILENSNNLERRLDDLEALIGFMLEENPSLLGFSLNMPVGVKATLDSL